MADCCVLFVNKEQSVASVVLGGLLKFWPVLSPTKQTLFLREMLNVIGALVEHTNGFNYDQYKDVLVKLIQRFCCCFFFVLKMAWSQFFVHVHGDTVMNEIKQNSTIKE